MNNLKNNPLILMYHSIDKEKLKRLKGIRVSPKNFEKQIAYLSKNRYKSYTLCEMIEQRENLDSKSIVITFDDGYKDNLTNALPILKKYNFKATVFIIINRFNNDWSRHRREKNTGIVDKIDKLSDKDIESLIKSGLVEIGAHTLNHKNFLKMEEDEKIHEIRESKKILQERFGIECKTFSYPFGIYKDKDEELSKEAGFIGAVTTKKRRVDFQRDSLFLLPRIAIKDEYLKFIYKMRKF
jgi:peptidoglycan/xylan/chitin deacetylase (PgdA/CDA1 family)